jgi:hypothetical protein
MITKNTWVRDTLIKVDTYNSLPAERQQKIAALVTEFNGLGYVSAWDIGADQQARMSNRERERLQNIRLRVFRIEETVVELLKTDEQLQAEAAAKAAKAKQDRIQYLKNRKRTIEELLTRKLHSKRDNTTKQEHRQIVAELALLQPAA